MIRALLMLLWGYCGYRSALHFAESGGTIWFVLVLIFAYALVVAWGMGRGPARTDLPPT